MARFVGAFAALCLVGCAAGPPSVAMDFTRARFLATPFPGDDYRERRAPLAGYPIGTRRCQVTQMLTLAAASVKGGFSLTGAIYFSVDASAPVELTLTVRAAQPKDTIAPTFPMLLAEVTTPGTPFVPIPITTGIIEDLGLVAIQPVQGFPLHPRSRYAAFLRTSATNPPLVSSPEMTLLLLGRKPKGMSAAVFDGYRSAIGALRSAGVDLADVAAMTVFGTGPSPAEQMANARARLLDDLRSRAPTLVLQPGVAGPNYCSYAGKVAMPVYQQKELPYDTKGGNWVFGDDGKLGAPTDWAEARVVVTVPRTSMPPNGFPIVVFVRAGAGGDGDPMIDREPGSLCPGHAKGTGGPARYFAAAGFAGISIDGPFTGTRQRGRGPILTNEDTELFNILNIPALRDNVRQSALEVVAAAHIIDALRVDGRDCLGLGAPANTVQFDPENVALFSHSMGSTIAPLALAVEPRFRAAILSGAGASYVENVRYKQMPTALAPVFEPFLASTERPLPPQDPVLSLFQWALEPADGAVYAPFIRDSQILQVQGIVDHYILPPIARSLTLPLGLDLAGKEQDDASEHARDYFGMLPLKDFLPIAGLKTISLPTSGAEGGRTAVVFQADRGHSMCPSVSDGHEVIFEAPGPQYMYRCFLQSLANTSGPGLPKPAPWILDPADAPADSAANDVCILPAVPSRP